MAVIMRLRPRGVLAIRNPCASCSASAFAGLLIVWAALLGSNPARAELLELSGTLSITHIPFLTHGYTLEPGRRRSPRADSTRARVAEPEAFSW